LLTCSATETPTVSGYTVQASDDNTSSAAVLSTGAIAAISFSSHLCVCWCRGWHLFLALSSKRRIQCWRENQQFISETNNPVVAPSAFELNAMPAVPALPRAPLPHTPPQGALTGVCGLPVQGYVVAVSAPAYPQQAYAVAVKHHYLPQGVAHWWQQCC
jgi:hypothetical protein